MLQRVLKNLTRLCAALASMLLITVGGMIPSSIFTIGQNLNPKIHDLPSSWQVPALLLAGAVCGPESGMIAVIGYITLGLFYLPVFHGGGSIGYLATPDFGYIAGFLPAVWITGKIVQRNKQNSIYQIFVAVFVGLTTIHSIGIMNLLIGTLANRWPNDLLELIISYSIATFPIQLLLCPTVVIVAKLTRKILIKE